MPILYVEGMFQIKSVGPVDNVYGMCGVAAAAACSGRGHRYVQPHGLENDVAERYYSVRR